VNTHCTAKQNRKHVCRKRIVLQNQVKFGGKGMFKFLKNVSREMKKVSWPKSKELTSYTITVITTVAFVAVFFFLIDLGISQLLNLL
jgi:preprotein translocase subunit SecE